eukprot:COSAG04_NODE_648_length_11585_cov_20.935335_8_plen_181_part_00
MLRRVASHLGAAPAAAVQQATAEAAPAGTLSAAQVAEFFDNGFVVARDLLSPSCASAQTTSERSAPDGAARREVARLADPIHAGFENHLYEGGKISYPDPANRYSLGSRILLESPDAAKVSCDHPKIVSAVEELLGGRAVLSQYQSYLSPPGYVNSGSTTHTAGHGTHCTPPLAPMALCL